MGFASLIDIMGSMMIGGLMLLIILRMNDRTSQSSYAFNGELIVQQNIVATVEILEHDFRKLGYCEDPFNLPFPSRAIIFADTSEIIFLTDMDFNGIVDTMRYSIGDPSELAETPNPKDRMLYREINGKKGASNLGITYFKMNYFDVFGNKLKPPLTVPTGIASMQIDLNCENPAAYNNEYRFSTWRQVRLASRNLTNR